MSRDRSEHQRRGRLSSAVAGFGLALAVVAVSLAVGAGEAFGRLSDQIAVDATAVDPTAVDPTILPTPAHVVDDVPPAPRVVAEPGTSPTEAQSPDVPAALDEVLAEVRAFAAEVDERADERIADLSSGVPVAEVRSDRALLERLGRLEQQILTAYESIGDAPPPLVEEPEALAFRSLDLATPWGWEVIGAEPDRSMWPSLVGDLEWPADGVLTSPFGMRRGRPHDGLDIAADYGAPVVAASAGTVVAVEWRGGYGRFVEIEHAHGMRTRYAHLRSWDVEIDDEVAAGDRIGTIGSSGRSTGPHLHFEVLIGRTALDPLALLP